ncbi:unnamed protein product [Lactuca virosa]|uniref:PPM-type phosphatase domain-containing protein n=1 Tax=Lactuca virosa TaxID=75947 RepID=A0AAU9PWW0_9ASTR|nr:unnamed protein product [Lactuca virosa]
MWDSKSSVATCVSCCLVGVVYHQTLFVANLRDLRVVLGRKSVNGGGVVNAVRLSTEHNANLKSVSRLIGDVYMKHARYNKEPIVAKFILPEPMVMSIMSATPTILSHPIEAYDSFLIFAFDGLWEHLTNEEAVDIVHRSPHPGIAKRLVKVALQEAAKKREMRYWDLQVHPMMVMSLFEVLH